MEKADRTSANSMIFINTSKSADDETNKFIGPDGLPHIGVYLESGSPLYRSGYKNIYSLISG